jgi:hypothetical protein
VATHKKRRDIEATFVAVNGTPAVNATSVPLTGTAASRNSRTTTGENGVPKTERRKKQTTMVSPLSGAVCPTGAHPGNTGGKPGRSGRPSNALREAFRDILDGDAGGIDFVRSVIEGRAPLTRACAHCGTPASEGANEIPSVDNRLRAVDTAAKYGLGERSEFSEDVVVANVDKMLEVAQALMREDDFTVYCRQADAIWNARRS